MIYDDYHYHDDEESDDNDGHNNYHNDIANKTIIIINILQLSWVITIIIMMVANKTNNDHVDSDGLSIDDTTPARQLLDENWIGYLVVAYWVFP